MENYTAEVVSDDSGLLGVVIAMSGGAAVMGSSTSGAYAGANATVRFISAYAAEESERAGLGIRFVSVLPKLTPTGVGAAGVTAYAARHAKGDVAAYLDQLGPTLTPGRSVRRSLDWPPTAALTSWPTCLHRAG